MTSNNSTLKNSLSGAIQAAGAILALSYPVLALSTMVRAIYQLVEGDPANSPGLTLLASFCYIIATIGFAKQPRTTGKKQEKKENENGRLRSLFLGWYDQLSVPNAWKISMGVLVFETAMTLIVGTLSYTHPDLLGRNVWQHFGADYGYFPLIQPLLGLFWLIHPDSLRRYGIRPHTTGG